MVPILMKWKDATDPGAVLSDLPRNLRTAAAVHPTMVLHLTPAMALRLAGAVERGGRVDALDREAARLKADMIAAAAGIRDEGLAQMEARAADARSSLRKARWTLAAAGVVLGWSLAPLLASLLRVAS